SAHPRCRATGNAVSAKRTIRTIIMSPVSFLAILAPRGRPDGRNCAGPTVLWQSPPATHPAPRVTPAVATPAPAPVRAPSTPAGSPTRARGNPAAAPTRAPPRTPARTTAEPSPAVTAAGSSPVHVRHVIDRSGGGGRHREDGCRLSSCGPARKNETRNTNRKHRA